MSVDPILLNPPARPSRPPEPPPTAPVETIELTIDGRTIGVPGGRDIRAILLGGAAGVFVGPEVLDTPLTFEATRAIGATLGSGVVMVFDDGDDLEDTVRRIAAFFRDESCGQCVPCRVGTERQEELVTRIASGRPLGGMATEIALLDEMARAMRDASICGLGQTASGAIQTAISKLGVFGNLKERS